MANTVKVRCANTNSVKQIEVGLRLADIAKEFDVKLNHTIIGATVNNKHIGLGYRVFQPKTIRFFDLTYPEGFRMYVRSLIFILYAAVEETMPDAALSVIHSVSNGLYCEIKRNGDTRITLEEIEMIRKRMTEISKAGIRISREELETAEALKYFEGKDSRIELLTQHGEIYTTVHHLGNHTAKLYGDLVPDTSIVDVFGLVPYYNGMLLQLPETQNPDKVSKLIKQDKMFATFVEFDKWQHLMHIQRLADLNRMILNGKGQQIIQIAEALHEKKISDIADMIAEKRDKIKIVLIAGPSSSGKTTFGKRLAIQLVVNGIRPVNLSIDNYFVNRVDTPRDENGDYDFEALEAIDIQLFNKQLLQLMNGEEIEIPKFDFGTGTRVYTGEKLKMDDDQVLIIEGTHGLTPELTPLVPNEAKFRIYISPLASINFDSLTRINTTDNRLIRRIVRDYKYRGYSAQETLARWPSVRRGEDKHIYPNQEQADVMFNSALLYELAVLKSEAEPLLLGVAPNSPQYGEARRLIKFLGYFKTLKPDAIPPTSIMREFLGGSSFEY